MGSSTSVLLTPEEKVFMTAEIEKKQAELQAKTGDEAVSEEEIRRVLTEFYETEAAKLLAVRTGSGAEMYHVDHAFDTDFHPDDAIVTAKSSHELVDDVHGVLSEHSAKITGMITRLKSGDVATKSASDFRKKRLTLTQKTSDTLSVEPSPEKKMKKSTSIFSSSEIGVRQEKKPPFGANILGTFSCHGIEPDPDREDGIHDKTNQDRGCVAFPFNTKRGDDEILFVVLDGHGEQGDLVSEFVQRQIVVSLERHASLASDPVAALRDTFVKTNAALLTTHINYMFSGCTAVATYMKGTKIYVANVGDSRCVMATLTGGHLLARDFSRDHKPDDPEEMQRIIRCGGFVAPPREPGLSARVYLDKECTMIGLAMARSIGDFAVKDVGVIPDPEVKTFDLTVEDKFMIMASDGVWEFISSQEAVDIVNANLDNGTDYACKELIATAMHRWQVEEGDYRDDITAIVVCFPLPHQRFT